MPHRDALGLSFLIITTFLLAGPVVADDTWVEVAPAAPGTEMTVEVRDVAGGVEIDVDLAGFFVEERPTPNGAFAMLKVPGCGGTGSVGLPHLPFRSILIPVPNGPEARLRVTSLESKTALAGVMIMPGQAPAPDCSSSAPEFVIDHKAYAADVWYPPEVARIADDVVVRGQRFLVIDVRPVAFNPYRGEVIARSEVSIAIGLIGDVDQPAEQRKAERSSLLFPTAVELDGLLSPEETPGGIEYLIIAHDSLISAVEPLAGWKRLKGLTTEIVAMSSVGTTSADLKTFLQTRYDTDPDLTYVLFVGDHPMVPSEDVGGMVTDLYYACLDGSDYFPDIVTGRIAVQTVTDCENVVDKILTFERDTVPGVWHGDYLMAAYFQDPGMVCQADRFFFETGTHAMHYIRDEVGMGIHTSGTSDNLSCSPYVWREDATWYPHRFPGYANQPVPQVDADLITAASTATLDITDAINGGVSLVQHRDHGGETGWGDPPFYNSHVAALANGTMTPIVYSINCLTGTFNMSGDCFAEAFMKKYPGGAVGVMAATDISYSGHNDLLVHGAYDSFWDDYDTDDGGNIYPHSFRPAEAYLYGKYYMYNWQGHGSTTQLEFELFHWHGDPEMRAFTAVPVNPSVTVDPSVPIGASGLTVTVDAEGALVAVTRDGVLLGRAAVVGGLAAVDFDPVPSTPGTLDVVVTGHNLVPWQGIVELVVPVGPWMVHNAHGCDDGAGNGDGIANPGETIVIPVTVDNVGADDATGVAGVLGSGSGHVAVTDPVADFPDVAAGATVQSLPDHFAIAVAPTAPNGHTAVLTLDWVADGSYSGSTVFAIPVCEPLVISDASIDFVVNDSAVVSWTTNVPASSTLRYGTTAPPAGVVESTVLTTAHEVVLEDLAACTDYLVEISSTSPDCYTTVDDNGGAYHLFTTTAGTVIDIDSADTPMSIPDSNPTGVSSTVTSISGYDVVDVNVLLNITHTYTGDLDITITGPNGVSVELTSDNGGSGENFVNTLFDDDAIIPITEGSAPFTGSFQPEGLLADLNGQPGSGVWTLKVVDDAGVDVGTLDSWQLQLTVNEPCDATVLVFSDGFETGDTIAWSMTVP